MKVYKEFNVGSRIIAIVPTVKKGKKVKGIAKGMIVARIPRYAIVRIHGKKDPVKVSIRKMDYRHWTLGGDRYSFGPDGEIICTYFFS
jgi:hypothetical protein